MKGSRKRKRQEIFSSDRKGSKGKTRKKKSKGKERRSEEVEREGKEKKKKQVDQDLPDTVQVAEVQFLPEAAAKTVTNPAGDCEYPQSH